MPCNQVEKHLKSEYQISADDVSINEMGKKIFFNENDEPVVGYLFEVENNIPIMHIAIDANTGKVISEYKLFDNTMVETNLQGQQVTQTLDIYQHDINSNVYRFIDETRNIVEYCDTNEAILERTRNDIEPAAVDALANIERVYDFFHEYFDRNGNDGNGSLYQIYLHDLSWDTTRNASGGINCIYFPESDSSLAAYLDVLGHEYTHGITRSDSSLMASGNETTKVCRAISEGLSDIFGELVEDYCDDEILNGTCNWVIGSEGEFRKISNPTEYGENYLTNANNYIYGETNAYDASAIISHSAYLMTQGINGTEPLTTEQLANLYYYMIPNMTASTDFKNFRWLVELQAYIMNIKGELSDSQVESVIDAFDRVGIERSYHYSMTPGGIMTIYDFNGERYSECTVTISKNGNDLYTVEPDRKGKIKLRSSLKKGIYRALIGDKNSDLSRSFYFVINDNSDGQTSENYELDVKIPTSFTSPEKEVVLALDVSGSMEGTPLSETKSAALQFTDTIFDINPNTKINLITYSEYAVSTVSSSNDKNEICNAIRNLQSDDGTNIYDAVSYAKSVLDEISTENKYLLIMSDGLPNRGEKIDGNYNTPIYNLTGEMKSDNITICTLGFFHALEGSELSEGTDFMNHIASEGYYYDARNISEIQSVFNDIAKQVGGQTSSIIRVACPVDVTVRYNGETLSSAEDNLNTRTSFGTLTFEGEENEIKMLRLNEEADYEICINGTGTGKMDYSISFADKNGDYTDTRTFENIPINIETVISTNSKKFRSTMLNVDTDGDGKFDLNYIAGKNKNSREFYKVVFSYIAVITGILMSVFLVIEIMLIVKRYKVNKYCSECGSIINRNLQFCTECGNAIKRVPLILPEKIERKPQHKAVKIIKLSVTGICLVMTIGIAFIYRSAPNTVFLQLRNSEFVSAEILYNNSVEDSWIGKHYLSFVTDIYLNKVKTAYKNNIVDEKFAVSVYNTIANMDMGTASDNAEEYLLDME